MSTPAKVRIRILFPRSPKFLRKYAEKKQTARETTIRIICGVLYALGGVISCAIECIKLSIILNFLSVIKSKKNAVYVEHIHYNTFNIKIKGVGRLNFLNNRVFRRKYYTILFKNNTKENQK